MESAGARLSRRQPQRRRRRARGGHVARHQRRLSRTSSYYADSDFRIVERVGGVAEARGVAPAQIALAWLLRQPGVTAPIVGASKMEQLDDAIAALDIELSAEECGRSKRATSRTRSRR